MVGRVIAAFLLALWGMSAQAASHYLIGDSLAMAHSEYVEGAWPEQAFGTDIVNRAFGGAKTTHWIEECGLGECSWLQDAAAGQTWWIVLGTNDLSSSGGVAPEDLRTNILSLSLRILDSGADRVFYVVPPKCHPKAFQECDPDVSDRLDAFASLMFLGCDSVPNLICSLDARQFINGSHKRWDGIHFNEVGHALMAQKAIEAVPEPRMMSLYYAALVTLAIRKRRELH
jgi:hypothetical protein